ncbi:MAG: magnesium/cobalt transporter CorA [Bacteroidota bacterium]|nr:magnesium/cobalt transporter CorA [Bacteroidota bacterium]
MIKTLSKYRKKALQPPGTLEYTGEMENKKTQIDLLQYNPGSFEIQENIPPGEMKSRLKEEQVNWYRLTGLSEIEKIEIVGEQFNLHVLVLEDILNTDHLPKIEELEDIFFITLKILDYSRKESELKFEHFSFILGKDYLISFQEKENNLFNSIIDRIKTSKGKARIRKADYLFSLLLDKIIDSYYLVLHELEDEIENIETDLLENPASQFAEDILYLRKSLIYFKRFTDPLREEIRKATKGDNRLISKVTIQYLTDINDHVQHLVQSSSNMRETLAGLMELQMANAANKMNNVMMTLTIIATIFIPLTFLAGIYGMNFQYMPELNYKWAYPVLLFIMFLAGVGMYIYMKKRKWF